MQLAGVFGGGGCFAAASLGGAISILSSESLSTTLSPPPGTRADVALPPASPSRGFTAGGGRPFAMTSSGSPGSNCGESGKNDGEAGAALDGFGTTAVPLLLGVGAPPTKPGACTAALPVTGLSVDGSPFNALSLGTRKGGTSAQFLLALLAARLAASLQCKAKAAVSELRTVFDGAWLGEAVDGRNWRGFASASSSPLVFPSRST